MTALVDVKALKQRMPLQRQVFTYKSPIPSPGSSSARRIVWGGFFIYSSITRVDVDLLLQLGHTFSPQVCICTGRGFIGDNSRDMKDEDRNTFGLNASKANNKRDGY